MPTASPPLWSRRSGFHQDLYRLALPAGDYTALRVVIGDGAGQNWWCVVLPPSALAPSPRPWLDRRRRGL